MHGISLSQDVLTGPPQTRTSREASVLGEAGLVVDHDGLLDASDVLLLLWGEGLVLGHGAGSGPTAEDRLGPPAADAVPGDGDDVDRKVPIPQRRPKLRLGRSPGQQLLVGLPAWIAVDESGLMLETAYIGLKRGDEG